MIGVRQQRWKLSNSARFIAFFGALAVAFPGAGAEAQLPAGYAVHARVDVESGTIDAAMHVAVDVPDGAREVTLWLYGDRLAVEPSALDEITGRWVYPGRRSLGAIDVREVTVDGVPAPTRRSTQPVGERAGRDVAGSDLHVSLPEGRARRVEIRLRYRFRVPRRFGRLGRVRDQLTAAAPWYPLVVAPDGAFEFAVPHRVRIEASRNVSILAGTELAERVIEVNEHGAYVPFVLAPSFSVRERPVDGRMLRYVTRRAVYDPPPRRRLSERPRADPALPFTGDAAELRDLVRIDVVGHIAEVAEQACRTVDALHLETPVDRLLVVEIPSRTELAATAPGWVLASDRIYQVFPIAAAHAFHDDALRRAMFRRLLTPRIEALEPPRDRGWASDLRGALLNDVDAARRAHQGSSPEQLVGWAGFHPAVDQLLYAPQIAFFDVYFGRRHEPDPFRDDPVRARFPLSRGRRLLEMIRDALGPQEFATFAKRLVELEAPVREVLAEVAPERAARLPMWLAAPALPVNLRVGRATTTPRGDGTYVHRVEVVREGEDRVEPVEVEVLDRSGERTRGTWEGEGERGVVETTSQAPLRNARVDPEQRIDQSPDIAGQHPLADDALRHSFRPPLLRSFALAGSPTEGRLEGFIDFAIRRKYDIDNTFAFQASTFTRSTGGRISYARGLGSLRHTNARVGYIVPAVEFDRLRADFVEGGEGGWRTGLRLSAGVVTHRYAIDPREGRALVGSIFGAVVRSDRGEVTPSFTADVRGNITTPLGLWHSLVLVGGAAWTLGTTLPSEQPGLGGQFLLRGYETDELVGRGRLFSVVEYRATVLSDLAWNAVHVTWIRELQLAFFGGAGSVFDALTGEDVLLAADVGTGLRLLFEWLGVQPGVFALDVAFPLTRSAEERARRPPFTLQASFDQYF